MCSKYVTDMAFNYSICVSNKVTMPSTNTQETIDQSTMNIRFCVFFSILFSLSLVLVWFLFITPSFFILIKQFLIKIVWMFSSGFSSTIDDAERKSIHFSAAYQDESFNVTFNATLITQKPKKKPIEHLPE